MTTSIATARATAGITQRQLADACGVSERTVQRWEAGDTKPDSLELATIATTLNIDETDLAAARCHTCGTPR